MMRALISESRELIPAINDKDVINAYSGIRCKLASESEGGMADYKIEESKKTSGLINLIGIESPGLTAAPAIAKEVVKLVSKHISLKNKDNFKIIKKKKRFLDLSYKEQSELIKEDERWGRIVCRCEHVTEAEIIKALSNPLGARSLSSVKYRVRAGMGRCQGGFCTQHIIRIMEKEFDINIRDIKMKSPNSYFLYGRNREKNNDYS